MTKPVSRTLLAVAALAGAAIIPAQTASGGAVAARARTVILKHNKFRPRTVKVRRGGTVTWRWRDGSSRHNVTGSNFRSPTKTKGTYSLKFPGAGTYKYTCTIHPGMDGTVIVS